MTILTMLVGQLIPKLDQLHDHLGHAGWPAHTQLDQLHDHLGHAGWPAHTQLDQLHDHLGHAG